MSLNLNSQERKAAFADLKTEYLFVVIPFILLVSVKLYIASWQEIILSPDWSLASCIIFGQITAKLSKAVARAKVRANEQHFGWYTAKRFLLVIVSITLYFGMLVKPNLNLGYAQIFVFSLASYFHFKDGFTAKIFDKACNNSHHSQP